MSRTRLLPRALALLSLPGLLLLGAGAASAATSAPAQTSSLDIVQRSVSFTVRNVNRTDVACQADGKTYTERGHITGPRSALAHPTSVTLFLHGLSYGEFFTNYQAQPGYDFAEKQATDGHVTVTIDRLGYDSSDKPQGKGICFGSRADIAHQEIEQLRAGSYDSGSSQSPAFPKVVLAGHSVGSIIAQAEAYSFGDIDGLMVLSYSDQVVSAAAKKALATAITACKAGGGRSGGTTGPTGYVYFGATTPAQFIGAHFYTPSANPKVVETTASLRNRDPCGDILSYEAAVSTNLTHVGRIHVPVLVAAGGKDAIYPVPANKQASLFTGSNDVTAATIPNTGHAVTLHHTKDAFQHTLSSWLNHHHLT